MPEEDGWTTVTDKKQKKNTESTTKKQAKIEQPKVEQAKVDQAKVEQVKVDEVKAPEDDSWTTVTDKKKKKSPGN